MTYSPEIVPSSPTGQQLQAAIQKQLAFHGWSTEDDTVMAEYCLVMLGNKKTPDQVSSELSDLIGTDFDPSFVSWLFTELAAHYPDPASGSSDPSSSSAAAPGSAIGVISDSRHSPENDSRRYDDRRRESAGAVGGRAGLDARRGPGPINPLFGAAMSGVKRDARDLSDARDGPASQRARYDRPPGFDGVPAGPRNMGMAVQGANGRGAGGDRRDAGRNGARDDGRSIFDRVQNGGNTQPGYDAVQSTIDNVTRNGNGPSPFPHPQQTPFVNPLMAQAAMAQAFAAMQNWASQQGVQGFAPNPAAFNPAFNPNFRPGVGGPGGFPGAPPRQNHHQHHQQPHQRPPYQPTNGALKPPAAPVALPTKPLEEQICKHGVDCTKPACPYSHPSPVATKESGLVLSSEACEKQLACEDPDCPKSHVSASQKNGNATSTPAASAAIPIVRPTPPAADPTAIPGAGEKMCKFAGSCTRRGCVFLHPWDVKGDPGNTAGVACRWAESCTRADCHFSHPPNRPSPVPKGPGGAARGAKSYSATFNNPKNPSIGAWPSEQPTHVSDRLKRFNLASDDAATATGEAAGVERIIPGEDKGRGEEKVEIVFDHDPEKKESVVEVGGGEKVEA